MRADDLLAVRRRGKAPSAVMLWLATRDCPAMNAPEFVDLPADADLQLQDWRPFVGLRVVVVGPHDLRQRVVQACDCVKAAHADLVVGFATDSHRLTAATQVYGAEEFPWPN